MAKKRSTSTTISPRWVAVLRIVWIVLIALGIYLTIFGYSLSYQTTMGNCTGSFCEDLDSAIGSEFLAFAAEMGLSAAASELATIAVESIAVLPYLAVGYILFSRRSNDRLVWMGAFMLPSFGLSAIATAIGGMTALSSWIGPAARIILAVGQITFLVFFYVFPDGRFVPRWTFLIAGYWSLAFFAFVLFEPLGYDPFTNELGSNLFILTIAGILAVQIYRYRRVSSIVEKQQTKWVVIGLTISLGGFLVLIIGGNIFYGAADSPPIVDGILTIVFNALFALIPVWIGIAIMRYRLWDVEVIINRALIYGPLSAILAGIFAASIVVINNVTKELLGEESTANAAVVAALIVASLFQPMRARLEKWINTKLYPDSINLNKEFVEFSPEVRSVIGLKDLLKVVVQKTSALVSVQHTAILLASKSGYRRVEAFPTASKGAATFKPDKPTQAELQKGRAVFKGNKQGLWVPLYLRRMRNHDVIGILDIGPRTNKVGFSSDDKKALAALGAEIGTSIYTAQLREKKG